MKIPVILSIGILALTISCSQKAVQARATETVEVVSDQDMEFSGYRKGAVVEFKDLDAPCDFQVKLTETEIIEALEFPQAFKIDGQAVWVKYSLQRRPQQCGTSMPVDIIDIKKREG